MVPSKKNPTNLFGLEMGLNIAYIGLLFFALIIYYGGQWGFFNLALPAWFYVSVAIIGVLPVARNAIISLYKKRLTIDLLASVALVFSYVASEWYSALFINLMLTFARVFSLWTDMKAKHIIEHLLKYRPETVRVKRGDQTLVIKTEQIAIGDLVIVEMGERIPIDGVVVSGQAGVNESVLTGESELVVKKVGDRVFDSTLNETGSLIVKTEKIGEDSTLSRIISLVEGASRKKAVAERVTDKFAQWYILACLIGSVLLYLFLDAKMVLAILLVVCADDIAVAIPLAFTSAIAHAAKRGILIKGSDVLENLTKIRYFMTDKTGTLTTGKPEVKEFNLADGVDHDHFAKMIGLAVSNSHHPMSVAILAHVKKLGVNFPAPDEAEELPGEGITVRVGGDHVCVGKVEFLEKCGVGISQSERKAIEEVKSLGYSIVALGVNKKYFGFVTLKDRVRPFARPLILMTKDLGIKSWIMLTGDNERVAPLIADELGVDSYRANLKPEDKIKYIEEFKKTNRGVLAMMGDGVNDAAALALADVSVAMGVVGTDATIEAADVALMNDNLKRIPEAIILSKKVRIVVIENFWIWGLSNVLGLALVAAGVIGPAGAATYNFVTDFFPIFNSLRINMLSASEELRIAKHWYHHLVNFFMRPSRSRPSV